LVRLGLRHLGQNWEDPRVRRVVFLKWLLGLVFFCLFYVSCVLALAGWQWGERPRSVDRNGLELMVVVDESRSMRTRDLKPDRLQRGAALVTDALSALPEARVGLVAFAGGARKLVPLTEDRLALENGFGRIAREDPPVAGSVPGDGLDLALSGFPPISSRNQAILLVSDGEFTVERHEAALRAIRGRGLPFVVLGAGTAAGGQIPLANGAAAIDKSGEVVVSRLAEDRLRALAAAGKGWYVAATEDDPAGRLTAILSASLRQSEQAGFRLVPIDRTVVFVWAALASLGLFVLVRAFRWRATW
jgi:Ca-activated chloride channel family protein